MGNNAIEHHHVVVQMETPKSGVGIFELPCGYVDPESQELLTEVEVHEVTGAEEDMLASQQVPSYQKVSALLSGCVRRIGHITDRGAISRIVDELVSGDRVFLVFAIRRVTLGDELSIREKCPSCGTTTLFMLDMKEDFQPKKMLEPLKRVYDVMLPSGKTARFRVATGEDEKRIGRMRKRLKASSDALSQAMLMRLELLEGEKPTLAMLKSLGMRDRFYLREQFSAVEGGVDTSLELECPSCGYEWEKELDTGAANFFSPGAQPKH